MKNKGTYDRKYYLHRQIKAAGFGLDLEQTHKTITCFPDQIETVHANKYVSELQDKHHYGVQILNPMSK